MRPAPVPPAVSIVGRKNSGKTTLTVALAAELKRRGLRIASVKHGHHAFEIDQPGRDSWRHFHEGEVGAVLLVSTGKLALIARLEEPEPDPRELIERYFADRAYDLVLVEGYKTGPFPKIEIHRRDLKERPLFAEPEARDSAGRLALVTDAPGEIDGEFLVVPLDVDGSHVTVLAELLERGILGRSRS